MKKDLPPYVIINDPEDKLREILTTPTPSLTFPLSEEDKQDIQTLIAKYDQETPSPVGLAAPQVGINKSFVFVHVPDDPTLKKWRPDLTDTMVRTLLINPCLEEIGEEKSAAYEGCYSVDKLTGPVSRHTTVRYFAHDRDGNAIEGIAHGFLARVLQHEVDHLNGKCILDHIKEEDLMDREEYIKLRQRQIESLMD
jgi:peptide deformylase